MPEPVDMSMFEAQFKNLYSDEMPDDDFIRLADIRQEMADIIEVAPFREEQISWAEMKQRAIQAVIHRLENLLQKQRAKRNAFDQEIKRSTQIGYKDKIRLAALEREHTRILAEIAARRRYLQQKNDLLTATEGYPWSIGVDGQKALPHQIDGAYRLLSAGRAILGDKPGLGKTLEAIMTIDLLRNMGQGKKVIIFTPKAVLRDFERAFKKWTNPTFVHILNQSTKGSKDVILESLAHWPEAIIITNYEVWRKNLSIKESIKSAGFDTIILDEAHILKNSKSNVSQGIREIIYAENRCPQCGQGNIVTRNLRLMCGFCEYEPKEFDEMCSIKNVYHLTGTPILNDPADLWPLLNMLDRKAFPSEKAFYADYCVKEFNYQREQYYYTFGSGGSERLLKKLGMRYTARTRESAGVKMPPQEVVHHWLELDDEKYPKHAAFVKRLREEARIAFSDTTQMTTDHTFAWYTRMRQAASWPDAIEIRGCPHDPKCYVVDEHGEEKIKCSDPQIIFPPPGTPPVDESVMMDAAETIVKEAVETGDRIVVFSMFRKVIAELERRCNKEGLRVAVLVGGMTDSRRQMVVDDFNVNHTKIGEHQFDVVICQYATGKVGLNLNGANQLLCIEREWNPGMEEQTFDRVRRLDSTMDSIVHVLHCPGTATDLIDNLIEQKAAMLENHQSVVDFREVMRKYLEE